MNHEEIVNVLWKSYKRFRECQINTTWHDGYLYRPWRQPSIEDIFITALNMGYLGHRFHPKQKDQSFYSYFSGIIKSSVDAVDALSKIFACFMENCDNFHDTNYFAHFILRTAANAMMNHNPYCFHILEMDDRRKTAEDSMQADAYYYYRRRI